MLTAGRSSLQPAIDAGHGSADALRIEHFERDGGQQLTLGWRSCRRSPAQRTRTEVSVTMTLLPYLAFTAGPSRGCLGVLCGTTGLGAAWTVAVVAPAVGG